MTKPTLPLERWKYFVDVQLWPKRANFDPAGWMENFTADEIPYALRLLEGFTYFSQDLVPQMFRSAFLNLSQIIVKQKFDLQSAKSEWAAFINSAIIVRVTGETPNDSDSGFAFARYARDFLNIPEHHILSPEDAIKRFNFCTEGNVIFVDDFVGSGNQFIETWQRPYPLSGPSYSFEELNLSAKGKIGFYYCPVICTELGRSNIATDCPNVKIIPAHFYGSAQSAISPDSSIWRDDMQNEGPEFVRMASLRAGIPDLNGDVGCWRGFHKLGLALAFSHGWPDATLPLFYSTANNWRPLLRKGVL